MEHPPTAYPATPAPRLFKRVSKACRRCRRLRTKCENQGGAPPCVPCRQAGVPCSFPVRGEPDADRAFRRPRRSARSMSASAGSETPAAAPSQDDSETAVERPSPPSAGLSSSGPSSGPSCGLSWACLPPYEEVVEGVQSLTTSFFQLGFLPKSLFFEALQHDRESVHLFLLTSILSVSARFTPSLVRRYGGGAAATRFFLARAGCCVPEQMFASTLESIQGFFLLSIAEWGNGDKNRSLVYVGIAIRLAGILRMHREETYQLPPSATNEEVVYAEVARRTFWMLETFENLHSGSDSPIAFSYADITVLLPCEEREFTFGLQPEKRAALLGTPPARADPSLARLPQRSLFATLLQTHNLWGQVARLVSADAMQLAGAETAETAAAERISGPDYGRLSQALLDFERDLPAQHAWSVWNLRAFRSEGLDLAFFSAVMILRLSHIILRRSYLHDVLQGGRADADGDRLPEPSSAVADQLFDNMLTLHEQIAAFFASRSPDQGYPALIVFCVYVCGSLANHLHRQPQLCPRIGAARALDILRRSIGGLVNLQAAWPFARRWYLALTRVSELPAAPPQSHSHQHTPTTTTPASIADAPWEVQFSDPLPSDSMFEAFDMYVWNGVALAEPSLEALAPV